MRILHVADHAEWAHALGAGRYEQSSRGVTLHEEGFIHASTRSQAEGVLERYYADCDPATLLVLVLDIAALEDSGSEVRWDDVPGQPAPFPHVYGPIRPSAVVAAVPMDSDDGDPRLPGLSAYGVAP